MAKMGWKKPQSFSPAPAAAPKKPQSSGPAPTAAPQPASAAPTKDEIAKAAYYRWLKRGGKHGAALEDWLEAEKELKSRKQQQR